MSESTMPNQEVGGMQGTVLYLDDDEANLTVLAAACAEEFDVVTTSTPSQALEIMREREIAVLLVDQRMPGMTGVEVAEATRQQFPDVIRILITAYTDLSAAIDAINHGQVRSYIRKPWHPDDLKATLREALELYSTRRKMRNLEQRLLETERVYALGVVAASVGHELRNPLNALNLTLDGLEIRLRSLVDRLMAKPERNTAEAGAARLAAEQVAHARRSVAQLTEITRSIEIGHRRREDIRVIEVQDVLGLTVRCVRGELMRRSQIEVEIGPAPPVEGSPNRLGQVFMNLLINALEALPERPRTENLIRVRLKADDAHVRVEIEDNGAGIPPAVLARVFDPFFTTKPSGGTGLGLAISKQIVEEMHGTITAESEVGRGTRFTVLLPYASQQSPAQ
jgi:signal transduction histidine kinase